MSYLLVGESPNRATARRPDLWLVPDDSGLKHTANRLRDLAGWTTEEYLRVFSRRDNVLPLPPKGWRKEHQEVARDRACKMLRDHHLADGVVCLGMRAYLAFSDVTGCGVPPAQDVAPCAFYREAGGSGLGARVAYLPHTSGLNRWWNDAANRVLGIYFLRGLLPKVPS